MKALTRPLMVGLLALTTLSSCYSLTVQSNQQEVPVSLSLSAGQDKEVSKHFNRQYYQWYILGLAPYDFWNSLFPDTQGLRSQEFVDYTISQEAAGSGGVRNLNVTTERNLNSWLIGLLISFIPVAGPFINGTMSVQVEGDVLAP